MVNLLRNAFEAMHGCTNDRRRLTISTSVNGQFEFGFFGPVSPVHPDAP